MGIEGKKILMVIAPENFRDEELFDTQAELKKAGIETTIASTKTGAASGMLGGRAEATETIDSVNADDYDAVVFVGGNGAGIYFSNKTAQGIAKSMAGAGKIVAAICIAPSILANAGLLKGKKATCYPSEESNLKSKGANFTGKPVEIDGRIITASGPKAARDFGKAVAEALS